MLAAFVFPRGVQAQVTSYPLIGSGDHSATVRTAELSLQKLGYYHGAIDGIFGPELLLAVKAFQSQHRLAQDGIVGSLTWAQLNADIKSQSITSRTASPLFEDARPLLRLGSTGSAVVHLQQLLDEQGYHLATDGDFGPLTYAAVRNFQAIHGLAVNGIADSMTMDRLDPLTSASQSVSPKIKAAPPNYPAGYLHEGDSGPQVAVLQRDLTRVGYSTHNIDGQFGPETLAAVQAFQQANGLPDYGLVGSLTWNALEKALEALNTTGEVNRGSISSSGAAVAGLALKYVGAAYVYGGNSPATGFDCSGFVQWIYSQWGVSLPRMSYAQWDTGTHVSYDELQPGDLVFFTTQGIFANHVGIYLGNGNFISATTPSQGVAVQSLNLPFFSYAYDGAVQVFPNH